MNIKLDVVHCNNLTFHCRNLNTGIDGITYSELLGVKYLAKQRWVYVVPRNKIWDWDTAVVQNLVEGTAECYWLPKESEPKSWFSRALDFFFR